MPISASAKPFLTKPSFEFYRDDVSKSGLLVHWNFSNLNCYNYTIPISTTVSNLVSNGTGNGNTTQGSWSSGYISNSIISGSVPSTTFIESNNKLTIEWVGAVISAFPSSNAFVNKGDSFRLRTTQILSDYYFIFGIFVGGGFYNEIIMSSRPIVQDRVYYITATYDGSVMKLFLYEPSTGVLTTQTAGETTILTPSGSTFSANSTSGYKTRSLKIYNRVINETEIFYNRKYISYL